MAPHYSFTPGFDMDIFTEGDEIAFAVKEIEREKHEARKQEPGV